MTFDDVPLEPQWIDEALGVVLENMQGSRMPISIGSESDVIEADDSELIEPEDLEELITALFN